MASIIKVKKIRQLRKKAVTSSMSVTANVHSSLILSTLMMEALHSSKTSVLITITRSHIPKDGILQLS
jgi:hypothetical protein